MTLFVVIVIFLLSALPAEAQHHCWHAGQVPDTQDAGIKTSYDPVKDSTTVELGPIQVSGEKGRFVSLQICVSFSYPGQRVVTPEWVNFELLSIVKGQKLKIDLFVRLAADDGTFILSSSRSAVLNVAADRNVVGERIVMPMPYETFVKITRAKRVAIKMDQETFELEESHLQPLRTLAGRMMP